MTFDEIRPLLRGRPFEPFTLVTDDGERHDIPTPWHGGVSVEEFIAGKGHWEGGPKTYATLRMERIARVEPLRPVEPPVGNGRSERDA